MRQPIFRDIGKLIILIVFTLGIVIVIRSKPSSLSSMSLSDDIRSQLLDYGVPVLTVAPIEKVNGGIHIEIQSESGGYRGTMDDDWNFHLVSRTAELNYLAGSPINRYEIVVKNSNGEIISSVTEYVNPMRHSQSLSEPKEMQLEINSLADLFSNRLNLYGMSIDQITVYDGKYVRLGTCFIDIALIAPTVESLNLVIDEFIVGLMTTTQKLNKEVQAQISLVKLTIQNKQGERWVLFIYDTDLASESGWLAEGVVGNWYPKPAPRMTSIPAKATEIPSTPPAPAAGPYPYPEPTGTPYP